MRTYTSRQVSLAYARTADKQYRPEGRGVTHATTTRSQRLHKSHCESHTHITHLEFASSATETFKRETHGVPIAYKDFVHGKLFVLKGLSYPGCHKLMPQSELLQPMTTTRLSHGTHWTGPKTLHHVPYATSEEHSDITHVGDAEDEPVELQYASSTGSVCFVPRDKHRANHSKASTPLCS